MGYFNIQLKRDGKVIKEYTRVPNNIPDTGLESLCRLVYGYTAYRLDAGYIAIGEKGVVYSSCEAITDWSSANDGGTIATDHNYVRVGSYSLQLPIDVSASVNTYADFLYEPSAPVDLSESGLSTGWFAFPLHIPDISKLATTSALNIRLGSSSSDYIGWNVDNADLKDGWNYIVMDCENEDETAGTVDWSAIDYFRLRANESASPSDMNLNIDDLRVCKAHPQGDSTDTLLGFECAANSRYAIDDSAIVGKKNYISTELTTAEGNNTGLWEFGLFIHDASSTRETGTLLAKIVLPGSFDKTVNDTLKIEYIIEY
jgi:hypothetical protein